jgi:hypothetical protein
LITQNPIASIKKELNNPTTPNLEAIIVEFQNHLLRLNTPPSTVKNYISDLTQYLRWLQSQPEPPHAS